MKPKLSAGVLAIACSVAFAEPASANIIYSIFDQIDASTTVTGTITTDGATGLIGPADITGWNLTLTNSTTSSILAPANSSLLTSLIAGQFLASSTSLSFDHAQTGCSIFLATHGSAFWSLDGQSGACDGFTNASVVAIP